MAATRAPKCSGAESSSPLSQRDLLQRVLSYVGPGHCLFLSKVSSLWRELYARVAPFEIQILTFRTRRLVNLTCSPQITLYSSVFGTPSRVRLAHDSGVDCSKGIYTLAAGKYSTIPTLEAAHELGMQYTVLTAQGAATCNRLSVLQFLRAQGCPWDEMVSAAAARRGDLEMLHWALEQGCPYNRYALLSSAASSGSFEMVAWVRQLQFVQLDAETLAAAAAEGHTAMCEHLRAEQCPWGESACNAAFIGHIDTLRWLHEHGCPFEVELVCEPAASHGTVEVMMFLQQIGLMSTPALLTEMLNSAGAYNTLAAAQWLRQQGAEWPPVLSAHGTVWSGDALAWARAEGCIVLSDAPPSSSTVTVGQLTS
jgi:hypothetical protein